MRRNILFIFTLACCALTSCQKRPENILPPKVMTEIITDLQLHDAACQLKHVTPTYNPEVYTHYYNQITEKYGIEPAQLDSSLKWYTINDIVGLRKIYKNVERNIKEMQKDK